MATRNTSGATLLFMFYLFFLFFVKECLIHALFEGWSKDDCLLNEFRQRRWDKEKIGDKNTNRREWQRRTDFNKRKNAECWRNPKKKNNKHGIKLVLLWTTREDLYSQYFTLCDVNLLHRLERHLGYLVEVITRPSVSPRLLPHPLSGRPDACGMHT